MNTLFLGALLTRLAEWPMSNSEVGSSSYRSCVHTKYIAEPGWHSQRNTALPRSEPNVGV